MDSEKRDRGEIAGDFLRLVRDSGLYGCNASIILRRANISSSIFKDLKGRLSDLELIRVHEAKNVTYTITDKGVEFLRFYDNCIVVLNEIKRKK